MTERIEEARKLAELGYSNRAIELYQNKVNVGVIDNYNAGAVFLGTCGDLVRLYIKLHGECIEDAKFLCYGCPGSSCAMSALTILIKGKSMEHAKRLSEDDILEALGGLPSTQDECAELAMKTLKKAITEYEKTKVPQK